MISGNPYDTSPNNPTGIDLELRKAQFALRKAEIAEVLHILSVIHSGNGDSIASRNLRTSTGRGSSSSSTVGIDWSLWKGRFYSDQTTICGHSFGAATTIEVLRDPATFPDFSQGIALDTWALPVAAEDAPPIRVPLLSINSEAFMWWSDNFDVAKSIATNAHEAGGSLAWLLTIRGTVHLSQTDIPILYPRLCSALLKARIPPERSIALNISLALEFLRITMPGRVLEIGTGERGKDEGLLRTPITNEMPEECRPDNKWIGMRLKIPGEFATRVRNRKERGQMRRFEQPGEELWMHVAPEEGEIERYSERYRESQGSGR